MVVEIGTRQNLSVSFRENGVPYDLPGDISLCLFRIFQECIRNAAKHSGAERIKAELIGNENEITLRISDRGIGFQLGAAQDGRGSGL